MTQRASEKQSSRSWSIASLVLASCASAVLVVVPTSSTGYERSVVVDGRQVGHTAVYSSQTLLEQGSLRYALMLLLLPVALTALPVMLRCHPWTDHVRAIALLGMVLLLPAGHFTQGGLYLPSALAMLGAILRDRSDGAVPRTIAAGP